jgi:sphinganine-1-phosphate aldolase
VNALIGRIISSEVKGAIPLVTGKKAKLSGAPDAPRLVPIPAKGLTEEELLAILLKVQEKERKAEEGKAFAYTYTTKTDMDDVAKRISEAYRAFSAARSRDQYDSEPENLLWKSWELFMHTNALNPTIYPSLRRMENEVVSMTSWMLSGDVNVAGSLTSGGTESVLMAVKSYRDRAAHARPYIKNFNMIASQTVHPAFEKAAHYFNVEIIHVPTTSDLRMDVSAVRKVINDSTILIVGSAPQYCHGVVDPIRELAAIAEERGPFYFNNYERTRI